MGIAKREMLEDYYMDEIGDVIEEWNRLRGVGKSGEEEMDAVSFLGSGGEIMQG